MEQSHSLKANRLPASQEIPRILWNPEGSLPHSQELSNWPYLELYEDDDDDDDDDNLPL